MCNTCDHKIISGHKNINSRLLLMRFKLDFLMSKAERDVCNPFASLFPFTFLGSFTTCRSMLNGKELKRPKVAVISVCN